MTNSPEPNQPNQSRLDRIEAAQERAQSELTALRQLIESNAKAIEAAGNQQAADRESRQSREETREDIRDLTALMRSRENSLTQREIRMQAGEIQNLADSSKSCICVNRHHQAKLSKS